MARDWMELTALLKTALLLRLEKLAIPAPNTLDSSGFSSTVS